MGTWNALYSGCVWTVFCRHAQMVWDALSCRSLSAKEPLIIGLFCEKDLLAHGMHCIVDACGLSLADMLQWYEACKRWIRPGMEKSHSGCSWTAWCVVNMLHKNGMSPIIRTNGMIFCSILYLNFRSVYSRLKYMRSVILVMVDSLPASTEM